MEVKKIYENLLVAQSKSYSEYSKFKVGAILVMKDGTIFTGANIENAAYGLCMCAERVAMFSYKMSDYNKSDIDFLAVIGSSNDIVSPCGSCRQVMAELLNFDTPVYMFNQQGEYTLTSVKEFLPFAFTKETM